MMQHSHQFVETYGGLVGYGLDRETNENTLVYYLQKFSDDEMMKLIRGRMSQQDIEALFDLLTIMVAAKNGKRRIHGYVEMKAPMMPTSVKFADDGEELSSGGTSG